MTLDLSDPDVDRSVDKLAIDFLDRVQEEFNLPVTLDGFADAEAYNDAVDAVKDRVDEYLNAIPPAERTPGG